MKHTWADPRKEWEGFQFTAYGLNWEKLTALPVTQQRAGDEKREELPITLGEVLKKLAGQEFEIESGFTSVTVRLGAEELTFAQPSFSSSLLTELIRFGKEGISPFDSVWFWYDRNSCRDDPHEMYSFFVVYRDRIVRESVSFSDYHGSGFEPAVFKSNDQSDSIWFNDEAWDDANTRYWYRKFYTETRTGQLMVLRDDKPMLFDYQSRTGSDSVVLLSQNIVTLLKKIHILLWVLIALGSLILLYLWK